MTGKSLPLRLLTALGGCCAAASVALSAYAAHAASADGRMPLLSAAAIGFGHGLALAALARPPVRRLALAALCAMALGTLLFSGGIALHHLHHTGREVRADVAEPSGDARCRRPEAAGATVAAAALSAARRGRVVERAEQPVQLHAGETKNGVDPLAFQHFHQRLPARHGAGWFARYHGIQYRRSYVAHCTHPRGDNRRRRRSNTPQPMRVGTIAPRHVMGALYSMMDSG